MKDRAIGERANHGRKPVTTADRAVRITAGAVLIVLAAALPSPAKSPDITTLQTDVATLKNELEVVKCEL